MRPAPSILLLSLAALLPGATLRADGPREPALDRYEASARGFQQALAADRREDADAARRGYQEALASDPLFVEAMVNLARIELESGTPEDARRWVDRALGSQPDYPAARALAGVISLRTGALVRAIDELRAARELAPLDAQVLTNLGAALIRSGRYSEAREVLDAALRLDRIPEAMLNLALAEDRSGEPARATHHYRAFLAVAPHGSPTRTRVSERLAEIADAAAAAPAPNGDEPGSIHALRKGDTEEERR